MHRSPSEPADEVEVLDAERYRDLREDSDMIMLYEGINININIKTTSSPSYR